tara:strand:- start:10986 stop:11222 length:237 start_codon:yes stop_codon:yes gene_type:complete
MLLKRKPKSYNRVGKIFNIFIMKKISLNLMKAHLTRDEMRVISGGSGSGGCNADSSCSSGCSSIVSDGKFKCDTCCIA